LIHAASKFHPQLTVQSDPARILVHEVNWLGDLVMTMPALAALRRAFPAARLSVLVDQGLASFFDGATLVDEVIPLQRNADRLQIAEVIRTAAELRARRFDLAVLFPNSFVSALRVRLARIPVRAGFAIDGRGWMLTNRAALTPDLNRLHQVHQWPAMLKATLGVETEMEPTALQAAPRHLEHMREWLGSRRGAMRRLVAIAPAAAYGPAKEWPQAHYAELVSMLAKRGAQTVLVGGGGDVARCHAIASAADCGAIIAAGQTNAGQLMALLALCDGFAGNDSGAAHVASALNTAAVVIFGSTNPLRTGPLGARTTILYKAIECSPCLARTCRFGHYRCLRDIGPGEVLAALEALGVIG
jgi:heptosyltransferase-2